MTGLDNMEELMDYVGDNLSIVVNDADKTLDTLSDDNKIKMRKARSCDWKEGQPDDILVCIVNAKDLFHCEFDDYKDFPFDTVRF